MLNSPQRRWDCKRVCSNTRGVNCTVCWCYGDIWTINMYIYIYIYTLSVINDYGTIRTRVFRKATHMDQYLSFNGHHPLEHKRGVVRTLTHRARSIVSDLGERNDELDHVRTALGYNGYPNWMLAETREEVKEIRREEELISGAKREERKKRPVVIPYIRGFSEELKRIFGGFGVPTYFKPSNTLQ